MVKKREATAALEETDSDTKSHLERDKCKRQSTFTEIKESVLSDND